MPPPAISVMPFHTGEQKSHTHKHTHKLLAHCLIGSNCPALNPNGYKSQLQLIADIIVTPKAPLVDVTLTAMYVYSW